MTRSDRVSFNTTAGRLEWTAIGFRAGWGAASEQK